MVLAPPDIDLGAWRASIEVLAGWRPEALAITHFGAHRDVQEHLQSLGSYLDYIEDAAAGLDEAGFAAAFRARVASGASLAATSAYEQTMPPQQSYAGLRRYIERAGSPPSAAA